MKESELITIDHLTKVYPTGTGGFKALKDINLTFQSGEFSGVVGPSGSGKTTLLNIIGTLDNPTEGKASVLGRSVNDLSSKEAARLRNHHIGFIFQTYNLLSVYTVYENVEFPLLLLDYSSDKREKMVMDALNWVNLADKKNFRPSQLSGGESQRVAIARAIVKKPELILADEPTANLDAKNSYLILEIMEKMNQELGTTFIFATHDDKVMKSLKRTISLEDGRVAGDDLAKA
ncbi:MAG: putative transport system ATP-binding protein [Candidatus Marinimicrobia bacterium]|jgi:putative ABC transport system ATP-binding protein|nr:putative transport system ATP-binding protein [Candidatus Neomarinimicrobiota bacterium]